jgi:hypothetical protein
VVADAGRRTGTPELVLDSPGQRVMAVTPSGRYLMEYRENAVTAHVVLEWLRELRQRLPLPVAAPR